MLKKETLLQELDKRKKKENAAATSQAQEVKGKTRCHQSNRLLRREREREARVRSREKRLVIGVSGEPYERRDRHAGIGDTLYTATLAGIWDVLRSGKEGTGR